MQTTVVGSYPKIGPGSKAPSLRGAITKHQVGRITEDELRKVEDEVTVEVLQDQARAGLVLVADGHIRWEDPQTYFASKIGGFEINGLIRYFDTNTYYRQPEATGKVEWTDSISVEDYRFAAAASDRPVKAVVIGPYTLARLSRWPHYGSLGGAGPGPCPEPGGTGPCGGRRSHRPVRRAGDTEAQVGLPALQRGVLHPG